MTDIVISTKESVDGLLAALSAQLDAAGARCALVIIGGSGLLALGYISRATKDVDVLGVGVSASQASQAPGVEPFARLQSAKPLPDAVLRARAVVAADFGISEDWLNGGPADLLDLGLPDGFVDRLVQRDFGRGLRVGFASRLDQIHFKLYAAVDAGGPGKHEADLRALKPTPEELVIAARWTRTHDPSDGYLGSLTKALEYLGVRTPDISA